MKKLTLVFIIGIFTLSIVWGALSFFQAEETLAAVDMEQVISPEAEIIGDDEEAVDNEEKEIKREADNPNDSEEVDTVEDVDLKEEKNQDKNNTAKGKKVFLTFDDGPTSLTPEILDILKEHDVQATFFVIGRLAEKDPDMVKRTYAEGNMILPHSYTHDYAIYSTFETFYDDFYRAEEVIQDILQMRLPPIFRFPGGSSNHSSFAYGGQQFMPELTKDIIEKGYYYIDWNVSSGDASPDYKSKEKMLQNIFNGLQNRDVAVVLFHDVARNTKMAQILPEVISRLQNKGYEFRTFKDITKEELDRMVQLKIANKPIVR
ncbi:polysaccharide deacetylase [Clostridium aceticum]|uniref:Polysaccharide deacetylase n=1 Tax=Clostridium aceticum TaxID=84022 RepID=A0A0G3WDR6_9CLOT|nr:polysaccharide deacetylase family protein [Clostridium aceticum]AKL95564.1 polysaccharide deacetylase [Clostridium aceticum]